MPVPWRALKTGLNRKPEDSFSVLSRRCRPDMVEGACVKEMPMKNIHIALMIGAALALSGPLYAADSEEANEKTVALASVPKPAVDAAKKALGADPTEAKIISGTSPQQYELEARNASGKEMAVHVRADGTIVKRETESAGHERGER
jgi:hypothetical protein